MSTTQTENVVLRLRELIFSGELAAGSRLMEHALADRLEVSRTPVRLALGILAQEGLLLYAPQRGFVVRNFSIKEIIDAIDVRGRLEAWACRLVAAQGIDHSGSQLLRENLNGTERLLEMEMGPKWLAEWSRLNGEFHAFFVDRCGNDTLHRQVRQLDVIPLVGAGSLAATVDNMKIHIDVVERSLVMHQMIVSVVESREPDRAEMLMQEHIAQGRDRLAAYLENKAVSTVRDLHPV